MPFWRLLRGHSNKMMTKLMRLIYKVRESSDFNSIMKGSCLQWLIKTIDMLQISCASARKDRGGSQEVNKDA